MAGFAGLAQWVQTAVNYSTIPSFFQGQSAPPPYSDCLVDDDVTMKECSPPPDPSKMAWDQLRVYAQDLIAKDPRFLTPHEIALLQVLNQQYGFHQDEVNRNSRKQADTPNDHVMRSPSPPPQTLVFQPPVISKTESQEQFCEDCEFDSDPNLAGLRAFVNLRHHPYARPELDGSSSLDEAPRWVKRAAKRKASRRNMLHREPDQRKEVPMIPTLEGESVPEPERNNGSPRSQRIEMKMLELLRRAEVHSENAGEVWNENAFLKKYIGLLQRLAEEEIDNPDSLADADSRRNIHDGYLAQGVQYVEDICKRELDYQTKVVQSVQAEVKEVEDLDNSIADLRRKLERLERKRRCYPAKKDILVEELQAAELAQAEAAQRSEQLSRDLELAMEQNGQDFYAAWKAFQSYHGLPAESWPSNVPLPSEDHLSSPAPPTQTCTDAPLSGSAKPSPRTPKQSPPTISPTSSASTSKLSMPSPLPSPHCRSKPRAEAERFKRRKISPGAACE